jgi:hypothetical protein
MITLDHVIVPSTDHVAGAAFFGRIFDLEPAHEGHFEAVRVNDALTLDFETQADVSSEHYAFLVTENEFDEIFARIASSGASFGSGPFRADDGEINHRRGGRGVYFTGGPDPHLWEIMTRPETGT